jgi:hypothetical protein
MSRKRASDKSSTYARAHLEDDKISPYYCSIFELMAQPEPREVLQLRVLNTKPGSMHVFNDTEKPLGDQIRDRRRLLGEQHPEAKGDKLVSLFLFDHVIIGTVSPRKPDLPPVQFYGVSTAPPGVNPATAIDHWHALSDIFIPAITIAVAKKAPQLLALMQCNETIEAAKKLLTPGQDKDATNTNGEYRHDLPDGTFFMSPIAWDGRYHVRNYIKLKTPTSAAAAKTTSSSAAAAADDDGGADAGEAVVPTRKRKANNAADDDDDDDAGYDENIDAIALLAAVPNVGRILQVEDASLVPAVCKMATYHSPLDEAHEQEAIILDPNTPHKALKLIYSFQVVLREAHPALANVRSVHPRTGMAINTQTVDVVVEQIRADVETGRADDAHTAAAFREALRQSKLAAEDWNDFTSENFPGAVLVRTFLAATSIEYIREAQFPEAIGRLCALTGKEIATPHAIKILAVLPGPVPGVLSAPKGGWVSLFCRATYAGRDMLSKSALAAEEAARKAAEAEAAEAAEKAKKAKEVEANAMDIDEQPTTTIYKLPKQWAVSGNYVLTATPGFHSFVLEAKVAGANAMDAHVRTFLATESSQEAIVNALEALLTALEDEDGAGALMTCLDYFVHPLKPTEPAAFLTASYIKGKEPASGAFSAMHYLLTQLMSQVSKKVRAKYQVPLRGPYHPIHLALARVLFGDLNI